MTCVDNPTAAVFEVGVTVPDLERGGVLRPVDLCIGEPLI